MKARALVAATALAAGLAACGGGEAADPGSRQTVVFGANLELSGSQQIWGRPTKIGLDAAAEAINAEGGIQVDGRRYEAAVEFADSRSDPAMIASTAQAVAAAGAVAAVGPDGGAGVAYEVWKDAGVITFTTSYDLQVTLQQDPGRHPLLFSETPFYTEIYVHNMKRVAGLFPSIERVAILSPNSAGGKGALESYAAGARAAGMRVVHQELFPFDTTDFSATLTAIKAKSPDLLIAMQSREQAIAIMQQAAQLGVAKRVLNDAMTPADALGAAGLDRLEVMIPGFGPTYSAAATIPDYDPEAIFGDEDTLIPVAAILPYYVYRLTAQAIEEAGTTEDPAAIARALAGQSHDGPFGTCRVSEQRDLRCETLFETVRGGEVEVFRFPGPAALEPLSTHLCRDGSCRRR